VNSLHLYFHVRIGAGQGSALYDVVEESENVERCEYVYFVQEYTWKNEFYIVFVVVPDS
jgi:hypothetical protein